MEPRPVWIETEHAWYILERPSKAYEALYKLFLKPIRIAQFVISSLLFDREQGLETMSLEKLQTALCDQSTSDCQYYKDDLTATVSSIQCNPAIITLTVTYPRPQDFPKL